MIDRRDIGSWLSGPPSAPDTQQHPAERLGRPAHGAGAAAPMGRRIVGVLVDGVVSQLVAMALLGYRHGEGGLGVFLPSLVYLVMHLVMVGTGGYTVGHRLLGLRVERVDGGWAGPVPALIRTALVALFVPAVILDKDLRGLHDRAAGTILVRTR